jgi:L-threonylcarbamoyladenylate synthase
VATPEMLTQVVAAVPPAAALLMGRFWPGPLTIIFPARPQLSGMLTGGTRTIGVRQPRQVRTCRMIAALGFPVTGTSANRAGLPPLTGAAEVAQEFAAGLDLILDDGPCPGGLASTIVDVTGALVRLVRPGAIPGGRLAEVIPEIEENAEEMRAPWRRNPR